jgi:hypothetical protein
MGPKWRTTMAGAAIFALAGAVPGMVVASAAGLGGVDAGSLAADTKVVAACDGDGMTAGFASHAMASGYVLTGVTLDGIADACAGSTLEVTLSDGAGGVLAQASTIVSGPSVTVALLADVPAAEVRGLGVLVTS